MSKHTSTQQSPTHEDSKIFASYSRNDARTVGVLVSLLRGAGTTVFRDQDSILPGTKWKTEITHALEQSHFVLVFWTRHARASEAVRDEYERAIVLGKRVVPVLLDSTPLDFALAEFQWVDLRGLWNEAEKALAQGRSTSKSRKSVLPWPDLDANLRAILPTARALQVALAEILSRQRAIEPGY